MTHRPHLAFVLIGVAAAAPQVLGSANDPAPITSGYIEVIRTSFDPGGQAQGRPRKERVWFSGGKIRTDELVDGQLSYSSLRSGADAWMAYPAAGRIFSAPAGGLKSVSYPSEVRGVAKGLFKLDGDHQEATVNRLPAWKYTIHMPARMVGDVGSSENDQTYLVYANADFPLILESTTTYPDGRGNRQLLASIKLGEPQPESIFEKPKGLKPTLPFDIPPVAYRVDLEKERISTRYGWKLRQFDLYVGTGKQVNFTHRQELTDANGALSKMESAQTLDYHAALQQLASELQPPTWSTVRRTGRERALGMDADILENYVQGLPNTTYTVVDHPQLGTFSVRHSYTDGDERGATTVKALRVEVPPAS